MLKTLLTTVVAAGAFSAAALAQNWAQPVREVDRPAKSAVQGSCYASIAAGESGKATDCGMYLLSGNLLSAIPDGKALVIEHASATCTVPAAAPFRLLNLGSNSMRTNIPVVTQGTNGAYNYMVGAQPMRIYIPAGQKVKLGLAYYFPYNAGADCGVQFQGHLESVQ
jgi:hypothetical protein